MATASSRAYRLSIADEVAEEAKAALAPHCKQIEIAGSIRRRKDLVHDVEIVCTPHSYDASPLFTSGIALVVNQWQGVKGILPCKYTRRILPCGIPLDLFMVDPDGFGLQLAIRTGSASWSHQVLARSWVRAGYHSKDGLLRNRAGKVVPVRTEKELFRLIRLPYVHPVDRHVITAQ